MGACGQQSLAFMEENTGSFTFQPSEETNKPNESRFHSLDFGYPGNWGMTSSSRKKTAAPSASVML